MSIRTLLLICVVSAIVAVIATGRLQVGGDAAPPSVPRHEIDDTDGPEAASTALKAESSPSSDAAPTREGRRSTVRTRFPRRHQVMRLVQATFQNGEPCKRAQIDLLAPRYVDTPLSTSLEDAVVVDSRLADEIGIAYLSGPRCDGGELAIRVRGDGIDHIERDISFDSEDNLEVRVESGFSVLGTIAPAAFLAHVRDVQAPQLEIGFRRATGKPLESFEHRFRWKTTVDLRTGAFEMPHLRDGTYEAAISYVDQRGNGTRSLEFMVLPATNLTANSRGLWIDMREHVDRELIRVAEDGSSFEPTYEPIEVQQNELPDWLRNLHSSQDRSTFRR